MLYTDRLKGTRDASVQQGTISKEALLKTRKDLKTIPYFIQIGPEEEGCSL